MRSKTSRKMACFSSNERSWVIVTLFFLYCREDLRNALLVDIQHGDVDHRPEGQLWSVHTMPELLGACRPFSPTFSEIMVVAVLAHPAAFPPARFLRQGRDDDIGGRAARVIAPSNVAIHILRDNPKVRRVGTFIIQDEHWSE